MHLYASHRAAEKQGETRVVCGSRSTSFLRMDVSRSTEARADETSLERAVVIKIEALEAANFKNGRKKGGRKRADSTKMWEGSRVTEGWHRA